FRHGRFAAQTLAANKIAKWALKRGWLSRRSDRQILERLGGCTRARTWDPMNKSHPQAIWIQRGFRHVHDSSRIEITMEFSFVGIQGRRERVIGSNRTVGGSQICDISPDRPPKLRNLSNGRF